MKATSSKCGAPGCPPSVSNPLRVSDSELGVMSPVRLLFLASVLFLMKHMDSAVPSGENLWKCQCWQYTSCFKRWLWLKSSHHKTFFLLILPYLYEMMDVTHCGSISQVTSIQASCCKLYTTICIIYFSIKLGEKIRKRWVFSSFYLFLFALMCLQMHVFIFYSKLVIVINWVHVIYASLPSLGIIFFCVLTEIHFISHLSISAF